MPLLSRIAGCIIVTLLLALGHVSGQGRNYGRSMVITPAGHRRHQPDAGSSAAAQILARGGSAVDAAIAANAVLAVVEPMKTGLGRRSFRHLLGSATGKLVGLNASGPRSARSLPEFLAKHGINSMPPHGIHSFTVPGAVEGWAKMHQRYGKLPWKDLFQSAIAYAEQGFPVTEAIQESWADLRPPALKDNPESMRVFLPGGKPPRWAICSRIPIWPRFAPDRGAGPRRFYKGEIAAAMLKTSRKLGGTMTAEDLAGFSSEWVKPISIDYRGWKIYELPPNSQGVAALEMLNIMETTPASPLGPLSATEMHKRIEAMKLAYADVRRYNADPRTNDVPVAPLLSKEYARNAPR